MTTRYSNAARVWIMGSLLLWEACLVGVGQTRVEDIFGRSLNQRGIVLVDWDGYMANPLIKFFLLPPANAVFPASATLTASGARLYFEGAGTVSPAGPQSAVLFPNAAARAAVRLSVFPDRDGLDEDYTLTIVFTGGNGVRQTNTLPIHVVDQDLQRANDFDVIVNFDRDVTGFFTNSTRRALVRQAAEDWSCHFANMTLDPVGVGAESTYIWFNNFDGGYFFSNTNAYRGYLLYAYGTTNAAHRSGGEANFSGPVQRANNAALKIKRSGGFEAEVIGNYNTRGWLLLTNDDDWLVTGNLGNETNDFYSIAHHEIGHALMFNPGHPGFSAAKAAGGFRGAAVTNYYGGPVPIDVFDHLDGAIDPESGQGVFGYEYHGGIPRKRWLITKLDLLCAQEVGYALRDSSALRPLSLDARTPPTATATLPFIHHFSAQGGIPFYDWAVVSGALPAGLALDPFTGVLSGTPVTNGVFSVGVRLRDYHENSGGVTNVFMISVAPPPPIFLEVTLSGEGADLRADLTLHGALGQQQVIQVSSDLEQWTSIATNFLGAAVFRVTEGAATQRFQRFYRAVVAP
ncbi:MAG: putative Ig domain-containing protein [Verrucomicrobia bacterium]|nr:putative Ig domain-containing protein [Verrucomicrobiota bacterium]MBI3867910.1 putative Ig domain-containing protein [Verrucomicrobiota bacterium]